MNYQKILTSPIKIGTRKSKNRFLTQAMECCDADKDGNPSELTYQRYANLFKGGAGMITLEAISVTHESRSRDDQLMILPANAKPLETFVKKLKSINPDPLFIFQLTHSGELSSPTFSRRVTVNPLYGYGGDLLSEDDMEKIMNEFVLAAKIAHDAGADGVDLKLCHGYLGSQILRPYNSRKWKYGGSWENRSRFAYELTDRIIRAVNDKNFLVGSKISAWEGFPGGFGTAGPDSPVIDLKEPIALLKGLEERGASFFVETAGSPSITVSLTQAERQHPYIAYLHPTFQKAFKDAVKPETVIIGSNYSVWGKGNKGLQACDPKENTLLKVGARNIENGIVDMIGLGRQSLADPLLPLKVREGREEEIHFCTLCDNCLELLIRQQKIGCCTYNKYYTNILVSIRKEKGRLNQNHT
ncbi:MAG: 2,4-dienoyl-CoA reductase [Oscillospiraceae bacterium]|jgi:2,4-dienoyl-CoA reductase-like NADH-dependent reductase (Old Yellow Enzyme family)|nr:2,4-dienoyl-CoA reductase [Oscillospiraceae bacterium]